MQHDWQAILLRLRVIREALLIVLAVCVLAYLFLQLLQRFSHVVVLFALGAIVAFVLTPAVNRATSLAGRKWVGTLAVYAGALVALIAVIVLLFQPLLTQSSALVSVLSNPSTDSVRTLQQIGGNVSAFEVELRTQQAMAATGTSIPASRVKLGRTSISAVQRAIASLEAGSAPSISRPATGANPVAPQPQIRIPPSEIAPLLASTTDLARDYTRAVQPQNTSTLPLLTRSSADAAGIAAAARSLYRTVSAAPVLSLDAQSWADEHNIDVNAQKTVGQAIKRGTDQAASILNNSTAILSKTANLLVDTLLILMISLYFVSDGARMIRQAERLVPVRYRQEATFFVNSVDTMLGQYIRGQLVLAALAGVLGAGGALVLGVPYAVILGVTTFLLELVPIIGPVVLLAPPVVIALLFTSPTTAIILLIWYVVFQQIVTIVIGPRVIGRVVGIHPLEAMAAALVGYPIAGILGSFLAVPVVGLSHVLIREAYSSWQFRMSAPTTGGEDFEAAAGESTTDRSASNAAEKSASTVVASTRPDPTG